MKHLKRNKSHMEGLIALLLFGVFAACVLSVLLTGAGAYRRLTQRDQTAYSQRTCAQYLATKVRQSPDAQALSVESFGDGDTLVFCEEIGGELYLTRIYCCEGWLCELFSSDQAGMTPEDGEKVLQAQRLDLELEGGLLSITITYADGSQTCLDLSVRDGEGGLL